MKQLLFLSMLLLMSNTLVAQGWGQTQKIVPDDRAIGDEFGWSLAMEGDVVAIGAKNKQVLSSLGGAVYIYNKDINDIWIQSQILNNSDQRQFDFFGGSVALDNNLMIVGARGQDYDENGLNFENSAGAAYIFEKDGSGNWNETQKIVSSDRGVTFQPVFGETVAISGNYAVVNARDEDTGLNGQPTLQSAGACYIFERDENGVWNEVQKIVASHRSAFDYFGDSSVSISGNTIAIGAFGQDFDASGNDLVSSAGAVYMFERDINGVWIETQKIVASDREQGEWFGRSVAVEGNLLMVGASQEYLQGNLNAQYGAVYVFERDTNGIYNEVQKIRPTNLENRSKFGHSITIDSDRMVVGAYSMDVGTIVDGGVVFMFEKDATGVWNETAVMYDPNASVSDEFGFSVAISGNYSFVGAYQEDEDVTGLNFLSQAGSVYIFNVNEPNDLPDLKTLSVTENASDMSFKVYPNPTNDVLTIDLNQQYQHIYVEVYNALGQRVIDNTYHATRFIDLKLDVTPGSYYLKMSTDVNSSVIKIIKQ